jgi:preprotein translocase subunit SecE
MSAFDKIGTFLGEVKSETKKINWPDLDSLKGSTTVVIVAVFIITIFISIIDLALNKALDFVMRLGTG